MATSETPAVTPAETQSFEDALSEFKRELPKRGLRSGPFYQSDYGTAAAPWYDNVFDRKLTPSGTVKCKMPLQVGHANNALDVVLLASHANEGDLTIPAGSTITIKFKQSDSRDGAYEDVGPTICQTAPTGGFKVRPDSEVARFCAHRFSKQWVKVELIFTGSITGGTVDCALAYMPR